MTTTSYLYPPMYVDEGDSSPSAPPMPTFMTGQRMRVQLPPIVRPTKPASKHVLLSPADIAGAVGGGGTVLVPAADKEENHCWICLEEDTDLIKACDCKCLRVHADCLKMWAAKCKLQNSEEKDRCRFCHKDYNFVEKKKLQPSSSFTFAPFKPEINVSLIVGGKDYKVPISWNPDTAAEEFCENVERIVGVNPKRFVITLTPQECHLRFPEISCSIAIINEFFKELNKKP